MIKCQSCGANNLDQSQYCDECGATLVRMKGAESDNGNASGYRTQMSDAPSFQSSNVTSVGIPSIAEVIKEAEKSFAKNQSPQKKNVHASLTIERGELIGSEFPIVADEALIGRWDADNGIFPDVDLDRHDPEAKVSRRHARILHSEGQYAIEDLGSTNGTFINRGRRLIPGISHLLKNGDEIIVGKTFLRFNINQ